MLTTHLSRWKVVIGKLESSLSFIFLVAFSALPVMALILVFGGVSFVDLFALVGILVISGIFIGSVGIFCSAVIRKTTVATIASYVIVVLLTLGILILLTGSHYILNVRAEQMGNFEGVDIGKWVYLLYLNPLVIYFGLLSNQVGSGCELLQICSRFGEYTNDFGVVQYVGDCRGGTAFDFHASFVSGREKYQSLAKVGRLTGVPAGRREFSDSPYRIPDR